MDGFNALSIKLNQCRNCFSIAQNDRYVAAVGDQIVIYRKENWAVQCVVPSKVFVHPYSLQFLSEHTFIVKNNYAQYMVYDVLKKETLWKFKPRGYDSIDINFIVSTDGQIFDVLTHRNSNPCCSQLIIYPDTQQYEIRDLAETAITVAGWREKGAACTSNQLHKGPEGKMYLLKFYDMSEEVLEEYTVEYALFQKDLDVRTHWKLVKRWRFDKPIRCTVNLNGELFVRNEIRKAIYFDEQYVVWNDLVCEEWLTGKYDCFEVQDKLSTPDLMKRRYSPLHDVDFWLVKRGFCHQIRQYKTWNLVPLLFNMENSDHEQIGDVRDNICDIVILNGSRKMLIGTMTGLYLCEQASGVG